MTFYQKTFILIIMERKHYLIGVLIFLAFVLASSAAEFNPQKWLKSPHVIPHANKSVIKESFCVRIIATTILAEARGEGKAGMYAVACVIEQRARNRGTLPYIVCWQERQFSCWNKRWTTPRPDGGKHANWKFQHDDLLWEDQAPYALLLAMKMVNGYTLNNKTGLTFKKGLDLNWSKKADHYHNLTVNPDWTRYGKKLYVLGNHVFYKLK